MFRKIIILSGPALVGKTTLAHQLTFDGAAGAMIEDGGKHFSRAAIQQLLLTPRVVICAESADAILKNRKFQPLLKDATVCVYTLTAPVMIESPWGRSN